MKRVLLSICLLPAFAALAAGHGPTKTGASRANGNLVTFQIDVSYERAYLNPGDIVGLRAGTEPLSWFSTTPMADPEADNIYTVTIDFGNVPIGNEIQYKFVHHDPAVTNIVWEEPISTGGGNRSFNLAEGGQTLPVVKWDDVEQPFIISRFDIYSTHSPAGYGFGAWVDVYDSLGLAHLNEVKIVAPLGSEHTLPSEAPGNLRRFSRHVLLGASPPELGLYTIEATNLTPQTISVQENITNFVEQVPTGIYPPNAGFIAETQPTFDWQDVSDPHSSITYSLNVHRRDNGQWIWGAGGLTSTAVTFNFDGSARESLQEGNSYDWNINAHDDFGNSSSWSGTFTVSSGNGPIIIGFDLGTGHDRWGDYSIGGWADVVDPQGLSDIQQVKVIDANGFEFTFNYEGSGNRYSGGHNYGETPPLGLTRIVIIDQSANTDTASENLNNFVEEIPTAIYPPDNGLITETTPVFDWEDVTDPQSAITYSINVHRRDNGRWIWGVGGLTTSSAPFNFNGSALENLQDGMSYNWNVNANDQFGNSSSWGGNFAVSSGDGPVIVNFDTWINHDQGGYRIDAWANVVDPQGQSDISMVKIIDAENNEYLLNYGGGNHYSGGAPSMPDPPPFGITRIVALDQAANSDTVSENLTNFIEELPAGIYPPEGGIISETVPAFDWQDVTDPQSSITYTINVDRRDTGQNIWVAHNLTSSEAVYNFNGTATEALQDGMSYNWNINAHDQFGNNAWWGAYFIVSTGDGPIITGFDLWTNHNRWGDYSIGGWADVVDPQGLGDIQQVKAIDANGLEFTFNYEGSGNRYSGGYNYGSTPPPLGETRVVVIDQSANADTASENFNNFVEEIPTALYPPDNGLITETTPVFDWEDVTDPQSAITYSINVHRRDNGQHIWGMGGLTASTVQFNFNGTAIEALQDGMGYNWNVNANDQFGNSSSWDGNFTVSSGDGPVIVNFDFWTYHGPWGYNLGAWADILDPQGSADLQTIKAIDAAGNQFTLNFEGGNRYSNSLGYGENLPPFGLSRIVAIDFAAHADTASENINNVIEQLPQAIHPSPNGYFSSDPPGTFQFTAVTDEQATINEHHLRVYHNGNEIWFRRLPGNQHAVVFNDNGQAAENLVSGEVYTWNVWALASDGNNSEIGYASFTAVQEPFATNMQAQPGFLAPGESVTISARCWDADGLASVIAAIESPDENVLESLVLFDDGSHNDGAANDGVFANTWITPGSPATYVVDVELTDTQAHSRSFNNAVTFSTNMSVLPQQWTTDAADDIDPSLAQLPDGRFFLVFSSFRTGQQEILWQTSTDMGASWSTAATLTAGSTNNRRPHAFRATNDVVWVLWERDGQIYYRTSNDNAASWSDETQLVQLNDFNLNPRMAQAGSGRLWVTFSNIGQGDAYDVFGVYSDDNGASWSGPQHLTNNPGNDHYAGLAVNSSGTLFLIWDQVGGGLQPDIYMKTSTDNGQTWSGQTTITNDSQRNAFPGVLIDAADRLHLVFGEFASPGWDLKYQFSDDAGSSWSNRAAVTHYRGHDYVPKLAEVSGSPWMVFFSDRAGNQDVWAGIVNQMHDLDPPPFVSFTEHTPGGPDPDDVITFVGDAFDETGVAGVELVYAINGAPQANLAMYDDGTHGDANAGDNRYTVQIGPYPAGTGIAYQVRATDNDANTFTSPPSPRHFDVLDFFVKQHEVLLVADDQSNRYLHYYTSALEASGYAYDVWERWVRGEIDSTVLQEYRSGVVVWYCGWFYLTLSPHERNALGPFLDAGGKLFITEQDLGYDLNVNQAAAEWYHNYLHANFVQDNVGLLNLQGVAGDPISDGLSFAIAGGDGANNQAWPSEIDPIAPAVSILQYTASGSAEHGGAGAAQADPSSVSSMFEEELFAAKPWSKPAAASKKPRSNPAIEGVISSGSGGLRIDNGSHKLVYLAFGFEGIADETNRTAVMSRVMNWLAGPPPAPQWLAPISVNAIATQSGPLPEIKSFNLAFGGHPNATDGFDDGLDVFTAPPGFNYYAYFAIAELPYFLSTDYRGWLEPFDANRDFTLPVVNALNITSEVSWNVAALPAQGSFRLKEPVLGLDLDMRQQSSVQFTGNATLLIQYRPIRCVTYDFNIQGGAWYLISLPVVPENNAVETLFPGAAVAFGWNYTDRFYAQVSHLEAGKAYWLLMLQAQTVEVCGEPVETYSRNYATPGWDLTGSVITSSSLTANPVDGVLGMFGWNPATGQYVQISSPFTVEPKQGYWILVLNAPCTVTAGGAGVAATTAKAGTNAELADFYAKHGALPPPPPFELAGNQLAPIPEQYGLSQNYPNPFNPETTIEYQLPQAGHVSLKIYNLLGREVRTLVDQDMPAGFHRVQWDGKDAAGRKLDSGVYLYKLHAGSFAQTRKTLLLK